MTVQAVAAAHYRRQAVIARRTADVVQQWWGRLDAGDLTGSWDAEVGRRVVAAVAAGQLLTATAAEGYVDVALAEQGVDDPGQEAALVPQSFAGMASDGRDLPSLAYQPVIFVKRQIAAGLAQNLALRQGKAALVRIAGTQVADAGRVAVGTALTARREADGWIRHLSAPTCDRCVELAGRRFRWSAGFDRHPLCDCVHIPAAGDLAPEVDDPPPAPLSGVEPAGATNVGRETPEQIYVEVEGDRDAAIRRLRRAGYLT